MDIEANNCQQMANRYKKMNSFDDLPGRGKNHEIEEKAEAAFMAFLAKTDQFILQQIDRKDYGTDCQIEVLHAGMPTNVRLHVQLKGTERELNADGSLGISVQRTNLNYLIAQKYSLFVAYHVPTETLRIASVEGVLRRYEHESRNWFEQATLTINFSENLTSERLSALAGLAHFTAKSSRDRRLEQITAKECDLPALLKSAEPEIHVPDDQGRASDVLDQLYESGADATISQAFDQFVAILGSESDAIGLCYMAEINLGMANRSRFQDRINAGIAHFEKKMLEGKYQVGNINYTIGNAHSALGDEEAAKAAYQAAAADLEFMADTGNAAQCLKNLGSSFERLGDENTAI